MHSALLSLLALTATCVLAGSFDSAHVKALTANNFKKTILGSEVGANASEQPEEILTTSHHCSARCYSMLLCPMV
jgi:hypothetical protein